MTKVSTDIPMTAAEIRARVESTTAWAEAASGGEAIAAALEVARGASQHDVDRLAFAGRIIVTGAGSSYYIAQIAAATLRSQCGLPAIAVPLSEILLRPEGVFSNDDHYNQPVVAISRSGATTEAVDVVRRVRDDDHPTIAVTCRPDSELAGLADSTLAVPGADESAVVMTRSFAALTALLMRLGTRMGAPTLTRDLDSLPSRWSETAPHVDRAFELAAKNPKQVVVLGGGAAYGLASEAVLKLTETSQISASAFHPLEFRHGPISVCEPGMLVVGLLGGRSAEVERRVVEETAALGATTWTLGPDGPGRELGEVARLPLLLHALQALAFGVAVRRGRDPEAPRNLGQVVLLGEPA